MKVGIIDRIITASTPPSRGLTTFGAEVTTISRSPATSACIAGGPAPKKIDSTNKPCFANSPFSCATHSGVCDAVIAAQPTRTRSWANVTVACGRQMSRLIAIANFFNMLLHLMGQGLALIWFGRVTCQSIHAINAQGASFSRGGQRLLNSSRSIREQFERFERLERLEPSSPISLWRLSGSPRACKARADFVLVAKSREAR